MISLPAIGAAAASRASEPAPDRISFVAAGATAYEASSTTVTTDMPSEAAIGDLLIAVVMHRSALTTPTGWSVVDSHDETDNSGFNQKLSILSRTAQSGDPGSNQAFTQASSERFAAVILALSSDTGAYVVEDTGTGNYNTEVQPGLHPAPALTADGKGRLAVCASTCVWAKDAGSDTSYTASAGYILRTPPVLDGNRLAVATKRLADSETISCVFEHSTENHSGVEISVIYSPA